MTLQSLSKSLPPGWRLVRFGDIVRNVNDNVRNPLESELECFVGLDHFDPESLHIKRWGLIEECAILSSSLLRILEYKWHIHLVRIHNDCGCPFERRADGGIYDDDIPDRHCAGRRDRDRIGECNGEADR